MVMSPPTSPFSNLICISSQNNKRQRPSFYCCPTELETLHLALSHSPLCSVSCFGLQAFWWVNQRRILEVDQRQGEARQALVLWGPSLWAAAGWPCLLSIALPICCCGICSLLALQTCSSPWSGTPLLGLSVPYAYICHFIRLSSNHPTLPVLSYRTWPIYFLSKSGICVLNRPYSRFSL